MGDIVSSSSTGMSPLPESPVASCVENCSAEEFSWIGIEDADETKEGFTERSEGISYSKDCESSRNATLVQAERISTGEDQEPNRIPESKEEQKMVKNNNQSDEKSRKEQQQLVEKQTNQLDEERRDDYGQLRENERREKLRKGHEDHTRKQQLQNKRVEGREVKRLVQQQAQEEVPGKGYVVMRREAEEKRPEQQEKQFSDERLIKQQQVVIEFQEFRKQESPVKKQSKEIEELRRIQHRQLEKEQTNEQEEKENKKHEGHGRKEQQQEEIKKEELDGQRRKKQQEEKKGKKERDEQRRREQQQQEEKERNEHEEQIRKEQQQQQQQEYKGRMESEEQEKKKVQQQHKEKGRREPVKQGRNDVQQQHMEEQQNVELRLQSVMRQQQELEEEVKMIMLNERQSIELKAHTDLKENMEVLLKERRKEIEQQHQQERLNLKMELQKKRAEQKIVNIMKVQEQRNGSTEQLVKVEKSKENGKHTAAMKKELLKEKNINFNCERFGNTTHGKDDAISWTLSANSPVIQLTSPSNVCKDITTEDEEYDRHSNHIKNQVDVVFVEGQISRSLNFSGDDGLNSTKIYEKYETEHVTNTTRLSPREIEKASRTISNEWHSLGGLLNIEQHDMDNILQRPDLRNVTEKAARVLQLYNRRASFTRKELGECLEEVNLTDLKDKVIKGELRALRLE